MRDFIADQVMLREAAEGARPWVRFRSNSLVLQLASLIAVIAAWQVISGPIINSYYLSTPRAVFSQIVLWITSGALWPHLVSTLVTTLVGFAIAAAVAIPLALWISSHPFVDRVLSPMIYAAYSMPKIVLAPALILWLGIGHLPAVTLSAVTAFFLVFFNFYLGLKQVPSIYADTAALLDASGLDTALKFRLPAASAHLATGISQGLIYAFHGALVGEMTASDTGMGYLILFAGSKMDSTGVMAGLMIVGTLALLLTRFLNFAFRTVVQPGAEGHV